MVITCDDVPGVMRALRKMDREMKHFRRLTKSVNSLLDTLERSKNLMEVRSIIHD